MVDVRIENVYKYYGSMGDVAAVHDLTMDIKDGEFVAILGPSGCGKSSTMRMISGLEHISAGTISFGGNVVNDLAPKDRDIAMVFENYALYPHKTVFDNVANPLKLSKVGAQEITERVKQATELLEIDHLLTGARRNSVAGRNSVSPLAAPSCVSHRCSCSTSRSHT